VTGAAAGPASCERVPDWQDTGVQIPYRQVRACYDADTVTVYQAYGSHIADPAAARGRFPDGFKRDRMTWIKPSFLWMMYRSGWASKPDQEHVLAVRISRLGFEWALTHAALSHFDSAIHADHYEWQASLTAPVRVQWDPERDVHLRPLPYRSLQVGLSGEAVRRYCDEWLVGITDVTDLAHRMRDEVRRGDIAAAEGLRPVERPYPLPPPSVRATGADG
jgi:Domain of unknown function (DUF4291)